MYSDYHYIKEVNSNRNESSASFQNWKIIEIPTAHILTIRRPLNRIHVGNLAYLYIYIYLYVQVKKHIYGTENSSAIETLPISITIVSSQ